MSDRNPAPKHAGTPLKKQRPHSVAFAPLGLFILPLEPKRGCSTVDGAVRNGRADENPVRLR